MRARAYLFVIAMLVVIATAPVYAEVMDKEPSSESNWAWAVLGGLVGVAAWRWRWWAGLVVAVVPFLILFGVYIEIHDPFVGRSIRQEAGQGYVTQFYLAASAWGLLNALGVLGWISRGRKQRGLAT